MHLAGNPARIPAQRLQPGRPSAPRRLPLRPWPHAPCAKDERKGGGGKEGPSLDKVDPNKADFSAYWAMRFRNFFSKRRQYLDDATRDQGPPPIVERLDERIAAVRERLARLDQEETMERQRMQAQLDELRDAQAAALAAEAQPLRRRLMSALAPLQRLLPGWDSDAPPQTPVDIALADVELARSALHTRRSKVLTLGVAQFRAALAALVMAPFTLPAALHARWTALFASARYEQFLMAEGERIWGWRNRMENERWFWEVLFMDRLLVPLAFHVAYQVLAPNNLLWTVMVPVSLLSWTDGKPPTPANMEFWIIAVAAYLKCWYQVEWFLRLLFQWG